MPITITVPAGELYNDSECRFIYTKETELTLEHSLVSISKWESKWHKPFFTDKDITMEETISYIKCMTIGKVYDENVYLVLTEENIQAILDYIHDPMTATTITDASSKKKNKEVLTNELIYCYMTQLNIPHEYEKWHINRLLMLIQVCSIKNAPPKKMSRRESMQMQSALNASRRKGIKPKG